MIRFWNYTIGSGLLLICLFQTHGATPTNDFRVMTRSEEYVAREDLPAAQEQFLHRLRGLYNRLREHPLLFVSRLAVASHPPDLAVEEQGAHSPVVSSSWSPTTPVDPAQTRERVTPGKRMLEHPLTEACPSVTEWITLNKSRDIHDNEVEIFQPSDGDEETRLGAQFFYSTRCAHDVEDQPCSGTSFLYRSKCLTKRGYVMALIRRLPVEQFDWDWIQVPISCSCGVSKLSLL
ncbi:hypothetical protein RvY_08897-2 [Ramazzottius varieornatus]|uniref:Nerve growth factor-related domain-containing protein n=1 Tax=Ramazzottius varieornatus TaxID=947166 RepID=A0A1D1V7F7_RAMVA|nr:hypothetical protein RvY_08897-2 [Ramazzottius varieornatus]